MKHLQLARPGRQMALYALLIFLICLINGCRAAGCGCPMY